MSNDKNKRGRIQTLKMLLETRLLSTQEDVLQALRSEGYSVAQTTLSRDMKQLKVAKTTAKDGKYYYTIPNNSEYRLNTSTLSLSKPELTAGFISMTFAENMVVVKTRPGYAAVIAQAIDSLPTDSIVGTIAGNDTIFIAIAIGATHDEITKELKQVIPEIETII